MPDEPKEAPVTSRRRVVQNVGLGFAAFGMWDQAASRDRLGIVAIAFAAALCLWLVELFVVFPDEPGRRTRR